jgi:3-dehydroquinate synthase
MRQNGRMTESCCNLVLTGFMGAGKSTVGKALALRLGRPFVDVDALIEAQAGRPIPTIFAEAGEAGFRDREAAALRQVAAQDGQVIATGGGALLRPDNVRVLVRHGVLVNLQASLDSTQRRLKGNSARPLARDPEALAALAESRKAIYAQVPWQVETDGLSPEAIVAAILADGPQGLGVGGDVAPVETVWVELGSRRYPVRFGELSGLPAALAELEADRRLLLVTDSQVGPRHAGRLQALLEAAGWTVTTVEVPAGEGTKSFAELERLVRAAAQARLTRRSLVLALGGGVVGDLAGFAAASYLRGVGFVQVPTSLLAMVDSSVGGKVAINLPEGKNLVGAFHQPQLVWIDPAFLDTLEADERRAGWSEVIKVAAGLDRDFFDWIEAQPGIPTGEDLRAAIGRAVALKAAVVARDEHERGWRMTLNLGHTLGHALEAAGGYGRWRHGEAVAWGLVAVARMARDAGLADADWVARLTAVVARAGLPTHVAAAPPAAAFLEALQQDKKRGDRLRFILPVAPGQVVVRDDLPAGLWQAASAEGGVTLHDGNPGP